MKDTPPRSDLRSPPPQEGQSAGGPAEPDPRRPLGPLETLGVADLNRLRWRCRRGLLENDLFIERFFLRHEATLTERQAQGLQTLMELADNDLLDLLLARREPEGAWAGAEVCEVLAQLRSKTS